MTTGIEFPDLEHELAAYLRPLLSAWSAVVDRRFPDKTWTPGYAVVLRDDSGRGLSPVTSTRNVGATVIGPQTKYQQTRQLAERVATIFRLIPDELSLPIADATVRGPYSLDATGRTEFYLTAELVTVGHTVTF